MNEVYLKDLIIFGIVVPIITILSLVILVIFYVVITILGALTKLIITQNFVLSQTCNNNIVFADCFGYGLATMAITTIIILIIIIIIRLVYRDSDCNEYD